MNRILVVIVTYNRKELLEEAIIALKKQTYQEFDILIVDNASTDGTYENVVKKYESSKLKYMNTGENLGGAGGFNLGIKKAILENYDFAWVMDDDSIPTPESLESLVNKSKKIKNKFSFISSLVKWVDDSFCKMNGVAVDNDKILSNYKAMNLRLLPIKSASFVGCLINLKFAKKIGLPIKEFFIYADDLEYTLRLSNVENAYLDFDSIVIHKMQDNVSSEINTVNKNRIERYFFDFRNCTYILKKEKLKGFFKILYRYFKYFYKILKSNQDKKLKRILIIF